MGPRPGTLPRKRKEAHVVTCQNCGRNHVGQGPCDPQGVIERLSHALDAARAEAREQRERAEQAESRERDLLAKTAGATHAPGCPGGRRAIEPCLCWKAGTATEERAVIEASEKV